MASAFSDPQGGLTFRTVILPLILKAIRPASFAPGQGSHSNALHCTNGFSCQPSHQTGAGSLSKSSRSSLRVNIFNSPCSLTGQLSRGRSQ
jgi:hypothetical protein